MRGRKILFSKESDSWETPRGPGSIYEYLNNKYGPFELDAAASKDNALCTKFYTEEDNSLIQDWGTGNVFCNPPYSKAPEFITKAWEEDQSKQLINRNIVLLLPARTSNPEWHKFIFNYAAELIFIDGRIKFSNSKAGAPFPSIVVVFNRQFFYSNDCKTKISTYSVRKSKIKSRCKRGSKTKKSSPTT